MMIISGSDGLTFPDNTTQDTSSILEPHRNRVINGDMRIDQRNSGASITPSASTYTVDRWKYEASQASRFTIQQNLGSVTPPSGFSHYLGVQTASAATVGASDYFLLLHRVEGFNFADAAWGTPGARTVTLSFRVRSSLTGTFGGTLRNGGADRSYPFSFAINAANTWETKEIVIPGDTSGTWFTNNGIGVQILFGLGVGSTFSAAAGSWVAGNMISSTGATAVVGTVGATFCITGVQFEVSSVATPFEHRPIGLEALLCLRYYERIVVNSNTYHAVYSRISEGTFVGDAIPFKVRKRAPPTVALLNTEDAGFYWTEVSWSAYSAPTRAKVYFYSNEDTWALCQTLTSNGATPTQSNVYALEPNLSVEASAEL